MSFFKVSIEYREFGFDEDSERDDTPYTLLLRVLIDEKPAGRRYTLSSRGVPQAGWPRDTVTRWQAELTLEEAAHMEALIDGLEVRAAKPRILGYDGRWTIMEIRGGAHNLTFQWWVECPPEWQSAKAVFDSVIEIAERAFARVSAAGQTKE